MHEPISKSGYMMGIQCPLLLWTHYNRRQDFPAPDAAKQAIFDLGHAVGDLAKRIWPDGVEVEHDWDPEVTAAATARLMPRRVPIFEASFLADRRYCRVDILEPVAGGQWDLVEVKAATSVKAHYIHDVAFQADLLRRAGVDLRDLHLMHIDNRYVRDGKIDPAALLHRECITDEANAVRDLAADIGDECLDVMDGDEPVVGVGRHCRHPYDCALLDKCHAHLPQDSPLSGYFARKDRAYALIASGCTHLLDVPTPELNDKQRIQREVLQSGEPHVEVAALRGWLAKLEYPLWHLDFETMSPGIPLLDGTRPFQQVPFQVSIHVQDAPGADPAHIGFLADSPVDPRPGLIDALARIGPTGTVLAYNASFERGVLQQLAADFPEDEAFLGDVVERMEDLLEPFRHFHLYHPDQHGSCSIKAVLPAFTSLGYEGMAIADGNAASREFMRAVFAGAPDREDVLASLRSYCAQDTRAMVELLRVIHEFAD